MPGKRPKRHYMHATGRLLDDANKPFGLIRVLAIIVFAGTLRRILGWSPPVTADEADDSCRALGVGRSL